MKKFLTTILSIASLFFVLCVASDKAFAAGSRGGIVNLGLQTEQLLRDPSVIPTPSWSCKPCVEVLIDGKCQSSGKVECSNGDCRDNAADCECTPRCSPCVEKCSQGSGGSSCEPSGKKLCTDGRCIRQSESCTPCNPPCDQCTETCVSGECRPGPGWECLGGGCAAAGVSCDDCASRGCAPCVRICSADGLCAETNNIRCPDGSCMPAGSSCPIR